MHRECSKILNFSRLRKSRRFKKKFEFQNGDEFQKQYQNFSRAPTARDYIFFALKFFPLAFGTPIPKGGKENVYDLNYICPKNAPI